MDATGRKIKNTMTEIHGFVQNGPLRRPSRHRTDLELLPLSKAEQRTKVNLKFREKTSTGPRAVGLPGS